MHNTWFVSICVLAALWSGQAHASLVRTKRDVQEVKEVAVENPAEDSTDVAKRKFYQWGGKRDPFVEQGQLNPASAASLETKRGKFYQWNGKRQDDSSMSNEKRAKFYQWGGKRHDTSAEVVPDKRKFYQWGGKRADSDASSESSELKQLEDKRKFYQWGGKRAAPMRLVEREAKL